MNEIKPPVIVLGMHRSGTSLVTGCLIQMGIFMGDDLEENLESKFFIGINDWLLHQAGVSWQDPESFVYAPDEFIILMAEIVDRRLRSGRSREYFGKHMTYGPLNRLYSGWGWKDPRTTFTWEVWKKLFPDAKVIHVHRNPVDVVYSLTAREKKFMKTTMEPLRTRTGLKKSLFSRHLPARRLYPYTFRALDQQGAFEMWKGYVARALEIHADDPERILHIGFENLIEKPDNEINKIARFTGAKIDDGKITVLKNQIDAGKRFAFLGRSEAVSFYQGIKDDPMVLQLGYGNIDTCS